MSGYLVVDPAMHKCYVKLFNIPYAADTSPKYSLFLVPRVTAYSRFDCTAFTDLV